MLQNAALSQHIAKDAGVLLDDRRIGHGVDYATCIALNRMLERE